MTKTRGRIAALLGAVAVVAGTTLGTPAVAAPAGDDRSGGLTGQAPCPGSPGYTCGTLTVPLDHGGDTPGTLNLQVAVGGNTDAPKGDLLFLTGGPGQPGVPLLNKIAGKLAPVLKDYRLVMFDQRGTGANALQCPALQDQMGASDLTPPTPQAVTDCAAALGPGRQYYSTADTVADIDQLRRALGDKRLTLDGVSYGTFTAERYALAHPAHVARLVLDSVVPQQGYDPLDPVPLRAAARVLTAACKATGCTTDPAADLAETVRRYHNGPAVLDAITSFEFVDPNYGKIPDALHEAAAGRPGRLQSFIDGAHQGNAVPAEFLSQGLHASTLCADGEFPWGTSDSPVDGRAAALDRARQDLTDEETWPFDPATATGTGTLLSCLNWPQEEVPSAPPEHRKLPNVPVLLLGGDRDLSTPLDWLYREAEMAHDPQVVIVPGAAHSVQSRAASDLGRQAVYDFLLS
ncbi:alpha/beta fold hydrolase [Kitasatospora aureofaciens]|uniref:alpha/beta fold hydrolase n=1 Tax=Kitasatospora aureofaciens TaxID=1894 RepID=UPI001C44FA79|nr:alpha/beta fold hydrolase [Kitasatospora aureofaciens]MBV6698206.1 alpha/beta hydrolase [Kitasatospora aureofaciens]